MVSGALNVDELLNPCLEEDVVATAYSLLESQMQEKLAQIDEPDVRIASTAKDFLESLLMSHRLRSLRDSAASE